MRLRHYSAFLLSAIVLLGAGSSAYASRGTALRAAIRPNSSNKAVEAVEKRWNPLAGLPAVTATVPETEPNDSPPAEVDSVQCGDDYAPAAVDVPNDIDFMEIDLSAGDLLTFGTGDGAPAGNIDDTIIGIFDDAGNLLDVDDDSGPGFYSLITDFPAPYTGAYYLAVIAYDETAVGLYSAFVRCTAAPPPPGNDTCVGALKLDCRNVDITGTTAGANNDYTPTAAFPNGCTGYTANGADVVYLVTLPAGGSVNLVYTSESDGSFYLLNACVSPAEDACVAGADNTFTGEPEVLSYTNATAVDQTLYLILDNYGTGSYGAFTLTGQLSCPPVPTVPMTWSPIKGLRASH